MMLSRFGPHLPLLAQWAPPLPHAEEGFSRATYSTPMKWEGRDPRPQGVGGEGLGLFVSGDLL